MRFSSAFSSLLLSSPLLFHSHTHVCLLISSTVFRATARFHTSALRHRHSPGSSSCDRFRRKSQWKPRNVASSPPNTEHHPCLTSFKPLSCLDTVSLQDWLVFKFHLCGFRMREFFISLLWSRLFYAWFFFFFFSSAPSARKLKWLYWK